MGLAVEARMKRPWTPEDINTLQTLLGEGLDEVDIALRLDRSVSAVKAKAGGLRQAQLLREEAERTRAEDEIKQAQGSTLIYRLMEPLTEDEAFALGLCLPEAEARADQFGVGEAFRSAAAKVERAVGTR